MQSYLITDPRFYPPDSLGFSTILSRSFSRYRPDFALLRGFDLAQTSLLVADFVNICRSFNVRPVISFYADLALELDCGIHLKGAQMNDISALKRESKLVFYSAHSLDEIAQASELGANFVTISPIFHTPKKGIPLGVDILGEISRTLSCGVFALGGIVTQAHVDTIARYDNIDGFASIRYFIS
ncbi:MAG: thiamine phosphate synthase [Wolinella sp.]